MLSVSLSYMGPYLGPWLCAKVLSVYRAPDPLSFQNLLLHSDYSVFIPFFKEIFLHFSGGGWLCSSLPPAPEQVLCPFKENISEEKRPVHKEPPLGSTYLQLHTGEGGALLNIVESSYVGVFYIKI